MSDLRYCYACATHHAAPSEPYAPLTRVQVLAHVEPVGSPLRDDVAQPLAMRQGTILSYSAIVCPRYVVRLDDPAPHDGRVWILAFAPCELHLPTVN